MFIKQLTNVFGQVKSLKEEGKKSMHNTISLNREKDVSDIQKNAENHEKNNLNTAFYVL